MVEFLHKPNFEGKKWSTDKSLPVAYFVCFFFGIFGGHQFYLGRKKRGVLYLCTVGLFGIGWLKDLLTLYWTIKNENTYASVRHAEGRREVAKECPYLVQLTGDSPDVLQTKEYIRNSRGMKLYTRSWIPKDKEPKALVFFCHGYADYCSWLGSVHLQELAERGFAVFAMDYEGHGLSDGLHVHIQKFESIVRDVRAHYKSIMAKYPGKKRFLFAESMGGAVALYLHLKRDYAAYPEMEQDDDERRKEDEKRDVDDDFDGAVLMAPMIKIADEMKPPQFVVDTLIKLKSFIPTATIVPTSDLTSKLFHDQDLVALARKNPFQYNQKPRVETAYELYKSSTYCEDHLSDVTIPFMVMHGSDDAVTEPKISQELYDQAGSKDKTLKFYEGNWHVLLFEPDHERVMNDIVTWFEDRS